MNLLPSHTARWWPLVEDVFSSEKCVALRNNLLTACAHHNEFRSLSIDGTFRVCLSILGQRPFNLSLDKRNDAAVPEAESLRRVITVRGRTGAVVSMFATYGEGAPEIQKGLRESLQEESLQQAEFIATDMPTKRLYAALKETLPNLKALGLDPIHLAMHYESASARHRTPGSAMLRRGLAKFSAQSSRSNQEKPWGEFFCGDTEVKLTARELMWRRQVLDGSMGKLKSKKCVETLDGATPWQNRADFIEFLAALSSIYGSEMKKKMDSGKTIAELLHQAAAGDRAEWLFNNLRMRHLLTKAEHILLPVGTTSNESLHAEINGWFRQTQNLHPATLKLKLNILTLSKLLAHNSALYSPTARQMLSSHVLARRIGCGLWAPEEWVAWAEDGRKKAELPIEKARQKESQRLKQFRAKRPAAARKRPATKDHRTPFNLTRSKGVRRAGVHSRPNLSKEK